MESLHEKGRIVVVDPINRVPFLKAMLAEFPKMDDLWADVIQCHTMYGRKVYFEGLTAADGTYFINKLFNDATSMLDLREKLYHSIKDPILLKEIDGFLTVAFNNLSTRINPDKTVKAASLLTDLDSILGTIEHVPSNEYSNICSFALDSLFEYLKVSSDEVMTELFGDDSCDGYNIISDDLEIIWLPIFTLETLVVLNKQESIDSINTHIRYKKPDFKWFDAINDVFNNENFNHNFKKTRTCRIFINDPYVGVKDYKLHISKVGKPVLFT